MNRLASALENCLDRSMASLIETTGGMSFRNSISKIARRRMARSILRCDQTPVLRQAPNLSVDFVRMFDEPWISSSPNA